MHINNSLISLLGGLLMLLSLPVSAAESAQWNPPNYTVPVNLPNCDAADAVVIDSMDKLKLLSDKNIRVFCFAPGDYRSASVQEITGVSGRASKPRVIRMLGSDFDAPSAFARAPLDKIPLLPPLYFRDAEHWIIDSVAFIDIDEAKGVFPMRFFASSDVVMNRLRVESNRHGIEFHHLSHDITLQNSLIGDMDMDPKEGNDAVCVAFEGRYTDKGQDAESAVIHNVRVVANEIYNCNDGVQLIWNEDATHWPDFSDTLIAANDIYIDQRRLTDCKGNLDPNGSCACTENAVDIKAGAKFASKPVVIRNNRFYGWRKTDSICNPDAQSWGTAISVHFVASQNLRIEQNLFWDVVSGVSLVKKTKAVEVVDNLFHTVPKAGPGNGIAIISYETVSDVNIARNRIVDANGWLSVLSKQTTLSCNVVNQSGAAIGGLSGDSFADRNSYYQHGEPLFKSAGDVKKDGSAANDAELCTVIRPLSNPGSVCLPMAVSTPSSPHACGAGYWAAN